MSEAKFLDGKKTYISAIVLTLMAIMPDLQELMEIEGDWTTFNFWFPLAKIAVGASTMFFRHIGGVRIESETNDERDLEVDALKAEIKANM